VSVLRDNGVSATGFSASKVEVARWGAEKRDLQDSMERVHSAGEG